MKTIEFRAKDILAIFFVAITQIVVAWTMFLLDIVYAPLPMFAAAIVGGILLKGSPRSASIIGAVAGLMGGAVSEIAYHLVRMKKVLSWLHLTAAEHFWLAAAETLLYASLLSFFMAFFSWGSYHERNSGNIFQKRNAYNDDPAAQADVPMFKPDQEEPQNKESKNNKANLRKLP